MYNAFPEKEKFFVPHFARWAGSNVLAKQVKDGLTEDQIRASWQHDLANFNKIRGKYLLYP
jgi:uncharacterized protein YbbC (DUF1343 family)